MSNVSVQGNTIKMQVLPKHYKEKHEGNRCSHIFNLESDNYFLKIQDDSIHTSKQDVQDSRLPTSPSVNTHQPQLSTKSQ